MALAASDPVIAAAGDIACDPSSSSFNNGNGTAGLCRQKNTSDLLVNGGFDAILALGDNQYYCGSYQAFLKSYDLSWGRVKSITRPVVGNHEYLTSGGTGCTSENVGASGYFQYFGTAAGNPSQGYYSYDIGGWHLIALNSNCGNAGGCGSSSPQGQWLKADLAAHPNFCTLAYWHIPRFSSGGRASSSTQSLWQTLYDNDAEVILTGHDHIYERFAPQAPGGTLDNVRGIRQFVIGSGGANHTSVGVIAANSQVHNDNTYGILKLTLHPTSYDWQFIPEAGHTFTDSGTTNCHGSTSNATTTVTPTATSTGTVTPTSATTPTRTRIPTRTPTPTPVIFPVVKSIVRANSNPTDFASVGFTVGFSESVTGVGSSDFALTTTGVTGAFIADVSGLGATRTVTVNTGSGNGTIRLDMRDNDSIKDVEHNPLGGLGSSNGSFTSGETYAVNKTKTILSTGGYDGWVLESTESSNTGGSLNKIAATLRLGDNAVNKQYVSILSFKTSSLPDNAAISSVTLRFKYAAKTGVLPFNTHGNLLADVRNGAFNDNPALQLADFKIVAGKSEVLIFPNNLVNNWYSQSFDPADFQYINLSGVTQFRLRFAKDDNDDFGADFLKIYSGNAAVAVKPQLIIEYYVP